MALQVLSVQNIDGQRPKIIYGSVGSNWIENKNSKAPDLLQAFKQSATWTLLFKTLQWFGLAHICTQAISLHEGEQLL